MKMARSIEQKFALYRLVKLRQRYILTKNNKLRLRYVVGSYVAAALILVGTFGASASSLALKWPLGESNPQINTASLASIAPAAGNIYSDIQAGITDGSVHKAVVALKKPKLPLYKQVEIGSGDTLAGVLQRAGVSNSDSYYAVQALSEHYDPRKIKPGQQIDIRFRKSGPDERLFSEVTMKIDPVKEVIVKKQGDEKFTADLKEKELKKISYAYHTEIETSLYGSAARAGVPPQVIAEVIRIYSWNVDFQRDIRQGDKIKVLYDAFETKEGELVRYGDVLYANLSVGGKEVPIYRYEMADGYVDYFAPDGHSVRKMLMKTPVDGARLSSGFGMRRHPIAGYNKMHKGIDFAAPTGTPIYAAGDGTIDFMGRKGGYGNYIRIRHNSSLKTAYAHLHRYAKGMGTGKRVSQGDVIGYIGSTGQSTGPHLHYEVHQNGKQVNPRSINLPTGEELEGKELDKFKTLMASLDRQYVSLTKSLRFAAR